MANGLFGTSESRFDISSIRGPQNDYHQLLVLGNGFDLECGLPTRFSNFFVPRLEALESQNWKATGKLVGLGYEATPTIWDFLLRSNAYAPWYSVEDAVNDLVLSAGDGRSGATGVAAKLIERIYELATAGEGAASRPDAKDLACSDDEDLLLNACEFIAVDCADELRKLDEPWTPQELVEYLGLQLSKLETNFSNYMKSVCEGNDDYVQRAFILLGAMLADGWTSNDKRALNTTVLTFNYTNPFRESIGQSDAVNIINVHGNLDKGIIFGIDGTKCAENPLAFPFSKTYRVITAGTDFGEGAVRAEHDSLLRQTTNVIKFYGHSLGEADYAYFQAVFDSVNLYASDAKIIFYYRPHKEPGKGSALALQSDRRARNTMTARATRLLAEYGKTLDNEDHGRNLMHKLMIEGRLEVRLLKDV